MLHREVPGGTPSVRPGQHGQATARRKKLSEYAKQLREKQKIKRMYGISEKQFRNTFERVATQQGITGHNLLAALETRLDNVIYRMGFAPSRKAARQLIRHRHIEVKQRILDVPSYQVRPGEEVRVKQTSRELLLVQAALEQAVAWQLAVLDRSGQGVVQRPHAREARAHERFRSRRRNSWSSSCTRSKQRID